MLLLIPLLLMPTVPAILNIIHYLYKFKTENISNYYKFMNLEYPLHDQVQQKKIERKLRWALSGFAKQKTTVLISGFLSSDPRQLPDGIRRTIGIMLTLK